MGGLTASCCNTQNLDKRSILFPSKEEKISDECKVSLDKHFDGHMTGMKCEYLISQQLIMRGFTSKNTIYAECACPDEINHDNPEDELSSLLTERYGKVVSLGGLAGLPFTG